MNDIDGRDMEETPLVSLIIPVYNTEKYLAKSISSAVGQSYGNIEIILVDDGSTDGSPGICDEFKKKHANIRVYHGNNKGLAESRNLGIAESRGEYLLFLDSDDVLLRDAVENLSGEALRRDADVVMPDRYLQKTELKGRMEEKLLFPKFCRIEDPVKFALEVIIGKGRAQRATSVLYRAGPVKKNKILFPRGYISEDIVFNLRLLPVTKKIAFCCKPTLVCLKRRGSITGSFHEDLDRVFLFVDGCAGKFLEETGQSGDYGESKRNALLCRNAIVCISLIFSGSCPWGRRRRYREAGRILSDERIKEAFSAEKISPYFESALAVLYFRIMFRLIRAGFSSPAFLLAEAAGRMKVHSG